MKNCEIVDKINNGEYEPKMEYPKLTRHRLDTVIDENKSVKWNKEEVERRNSESIKAREEYRNSMYEGESKFKEDVDSYLEYLYEGSLNKAQANVIVKKAWEENHSEGFLSVLDKADELAEWTIEIISLA